MKFSASGSALSGLALTLAAATFAQPLLAPPAHAAGAAGAPASGAARAATGWLATQLTGGVIHNDTYDFDDLGLTMDIGLSMDEVGGDQAMVRQIRSSLAGRVEEYAAPSATERYAGSLAKSMVFAQVSGADPRTYGGVDLVAQTEARVVASGPSAGRLRDESAYGDYANLFGQALAARGLSVAGSAKAAATTDFLLQQQCASGYFRVLFTPDATAADQSCVDGTDPADTDATAFAVVQLAKVSPRPAAVDRAITRAVEWLATTQRADGSFGGSPFTPDPNTNSTGLAASAFAVTGACERSGRAADWVATLQVGAQPDGSPLADEEGALAYDRAALDGAATAGIGAGRDQWWRATVQAVAGLTHARGSAKALTATSTGSEPGSTATLTATGGAPGDRFCLTGPGIDGTRTAVVGSDGILTALVVLPAAAGAATYTLTGRDGATTHTVLVGAAESARGSVAGVRLAGPAGFHKGGSKVALEVIGATPGARFALRGPGISGATVVVGSDGVLARVVRLPRTTGAATYVLTGSDGRATGRVRVLGKRTLAVSTLASDGPRTRVLVRRLAAGEKVRLRIAGTTVATGRADAKGRFLARVALPGGRGKVRIRAVGQFAALRSGSTTVASR
ncbi:prenyltransferase/squalene oxidase repeat-containing protein [Nocardioides sp. zg-1228]|uniref:prenyltransferase/squalene oxidase repeat-containing protein n=1 Tax=Nocardioides sp. zg-1228 TaxID=2763008 RepID=UPI0016430553|nr:prenyltransferase/squalene oxidase repeat-containing protein [Nocardioides sp. zg-1228]MBC2933251.1 terpene cyclase/mutase family protein [Nocardioides sp. zg-1228]QSF56581.1 terpene cyclase/mutase family protein [Nocardioides sp. zg-1228]